MSAVGEGDGPKLTKGLCTRSPGAVVVCRKDRYSRTARGRNYAVQSAVTAEGVSSSAFDAATASRPEVVHRRFVVVPCSVGTCEWCAVVLPGRLCWRSDPPPPLWVSRTWPVKYWAHLQPNTVARERHWRHQRPTGPMSWVWRGPPGYSQRMEDSRTASIGGSDGLSARLPATARPEVDDARCYSTSNRWLPVRSPGSRRLSVHISALAWSNGRRARSAVSELSTTRSVCASAAAGATTSRRGRDAPRPSDARESAHDQLASRTGRRTPSRAWRRSRWISTRSASARPLLKRSSAPRGPSSNRPDRGRAREGEVPHSPLGAARRAHKGARA